MLLRLQNRVSASYLISFVTQIQFSSGHILMHLWHAVFCYFEFLLVEVGTFSPTCAQLRLTKENPSWRDGFDILASDGAHWPGSQNFCWRQCVSCVQWGWYSSREHLTHLVCSDSLQSSNTRKPGVWKKREERKGGGRKINGCNKPCIRTVTTKHGLQKDTSSFFTF